MALRDDWCDAKKVKERTFLERAREAGGMSCERKTVKKVRGVPMSCARVFTHELRCGRKEKEFELSCERSLLKGRARCTGEGRRE